MKISKDSRRAARQFLRLSTQGGRLNEDTVRMIVARVAAEKPRHYLGTLTAFSHLLKLEQQKRTVTVESATALNADDRISIENRLKTKHGDNLIFTFRTNEALLGGLRIQVGSNVWDGSVKSRLDSLSAQLTA